MASEWQDSSLDQFIEIKHGFAFKGQYIHDEPRGDVLLTPGNFAIGGGFKAGKLKYYDGPVPEDYVLWEGDLIVTMTDLSKQADTLGYPALVPSRVDGRRYLHNQRLGKVHIKSAEILDKCFLQYLLRSAEYRHEVLSSASGTTVKHTSPERIKRFAFSRPPLDEQRAIAHILGTLDGKIELNRRMIETLEAMARALFKSWFVDFDPVRAKAEGRDPGLPQPLADLFPSRLLDSELGEIPEGWEVATLPEVIEVNPSRSLAKGQTAPYLDMANMPTRGHTPDAVVDRPFGSGMRFTNGDTLVARITPCLENGKTAYVDFLKHGQVGWGSTEYIVLRPKKPLPAEFAYCLARSESFRDFAIQSMTGSSGRQRVPAASLEHFLLPASSAAVARAFGRAVAPLFLRASEAATESRILAKLRDTLLPKLISGELRLENGAHLAMETTV
jgi:type I restriction enzyme S subunit